VCYQGWSFVGTHPPMHGNLVVRSNVLLRTGRSPKFLTGSWQYTLALFTAAARINMFPQWLRPFVAPILTTATRRHFADCLKAAEPVIKKRLAELEHRKATASSSPITHVCLRSHINAISIEALTNRWFLRTTRYNGSSKRAGQEATRSIWILRSSVAVSSQ
jgi:hypothetical protein